MSDRNLTGIIPDRPARKLSEGDKIRVTGWPMLKGLEDGREYRVAYVSYLRGNPYYGFRLNRGRKIVARHFCNHIDLWIGRCREDLNRIEILQSNLTPAVCGV